MPELPWPSTGCIMKKSRPNSDASRHFKRLNFWELKRNWTSTKRRYKVSKALMSRNIPNLRSLKMMRNRCTVSALTKKMKQTPWTSNQVKLVRSKRRMKTAESVPRTRETFSKWLILLTTSLTLREISRSRTSNSWWKTNQKSSTSLLLTPKTKINWRKAPKSTSSSRSASIRNGEVSKAPISCKTSRRSIHLPMQSSRFRGAPLAITQAKGSRQVGITIRTGRLTHFLNSGLFPQMMHTPTNQRKSRPTSLSGWRCDTMMMTELPHSHQVWT